jgi:pimeloyl-ACP methyl ester carboxylesterase
MSRLGVAAALVAALVAAAPAFAQKFKLPEKPAEAPKPVEVPAEPAPPAPAPEAKPPKPFPSPQVKLPADMAFREGTSDVFGQTIAWFEIGEGPAVVLLHGVAGDRRDWVHVMRKLYAGHRVIAYDAPGFGASAKPFIDYGLDTMTDFLEGFLDARQLDKVTLVGHAEGGMAALSFASTHPEQVAGVVVISPLTASAIGPSRAKVLLPTSRADVRSMLTRLYAGARAKPDDATVDRIFTELLARDDARAAERLIASLPADLAAVERQVSQIRSPVLLIRGDADALVAASAGGELAVRIPAAQLESPGGCGHKAHVECADAVAALIAAFAPAP